MKIGDTVKLKKGTVRLERGGKRVAKVIEKLSDVEGGLVLSERLGGFRYWNVLDLEVVNPQ